MTIQLVSAVCFLLIVSCNTKNEEVTEKLRSQPITGTWKLQHATLIEKGDTVKTDYTKDRSFIKIINDTHFAFLHHDLNKGKDSAAVFSSGGGTYSLKDSIYTEHLEYCTAREWEGHDFTFTLTFNKDTLIQQGREVIESEGIDRINIEKYIRVR
ncbi:MAG: hypothetical protein ACXWV4_11885 [Flavitalea sp.]